MNNFTPVLLICLVVGIAILIYLQLRRKPEPEKEDDQSMIMMQDQLKEIRQSLQLQQGDLQKNIQNQFAQSSRIIQSVTERLTKLDETNKQVVGFAEQLQSLENILKNPKQRGILGEYFLETLLKNVFAPNQYQMQYKFSDGEIVDAVVFVQNKIIPIDSKFSLDAYNKLINEKDPTRHKDAEKQIKSDLKKRIDETAKYIRPHENTTDFAFMFIPSEGIYYDLLVNTIGQIQVDTGGLIDYAFNKKVIIVSPNSFYAYLQTVKQGLRYLETERDIQEIVKNVEMLGKHLLSYDEFMKKIGNNLGTTVNMYNQAYKEFKKIDKDILKISDTGGTIEPEHVDKPQLET